MIARLAAGLLRERLTSSAAVVLLGPRQIGKTTLARDLVDAVAPDAVYLDLERPADQRRLEDADAFLRAQAPRLVVLDEVHRVPELFETLRGVIDDNRRAGFRTGQFLLLGSASLNLLQLTSESLAGRIAHLDLSGVNLDEAADAGIDASSVWLRGGFPDSLTPSDDGASLRWRLDLIRSYLERDVPMFAPRIPAETLRRLWTMLAHTSGGLLNASRLAESLGVSSPAVARYVDLLCDLALVRRLAPWHVNTGKRVVKTPKVFVRDTGLLHALLELESLNDVLGHPAAGPSFESLAVESLVNAAGNSLQPYHYRSARGEEVDLVLVRGGRPVIAAEIKLSSAPSMSASTHRAITDVGAARNYLVHPDAHGEPYPLPDGTTVIGLTRLVRELRSVPSG